MKVSHPRARQQAGFSLIEILVVMVIIGILVSLVAPSVLNRVDDARLQKVEADFKAIESALSIYNLDNFTYPSTDQGLQALVSKPDGQPEARNWKKGGYLKEMPLDPWGREYLYLSPGEDGREFDLYTLGADGVSGGEDQNADMFNGESTTP